jgi:hypothetical protein
MAVFNPPGWLQNAGATHTAVQLRNAVSSLIAGVTASADMRPRGGVNGSMGNKLQVTQTGSPSMAVIIKSGAAWIPGSENITQGAYSVVNDADVTVSVTAAHATLARIDLVCFKVEDSQYSGGANTCSLVVVAGTPSGSPAVPTAPNNSLILAQIAVGAAVSTITNANITDRRSYLAGAGGTITCTSTTRPAAGTIPFGQTIFELDTLKGYITVDGGTNWVQNYPPQTKIAENILVGTSASISFASIPQTYRNLTLKIVARGDTAAAFVSCRIRFNGDTGTNYDCEQVGGVGATASAFESLAQTGADLGEAAAATTVAGSCSVYNVHIPWYAGTTFWKGLISNHGMMAQTSGGAANALYSKQWIGRWKNTAAITSITIIPGSGNFIAGSSFALYGEV